MVHVIRTPAGYLVQDDRRHVYLDAEGRWRPVPWSFASRQAAMAALRTTHQRSERAAR